MSDDNLFEVFEGDDIFEEDDGEIRGDAEGESSNKTFMIAVGVLGGLLVLAIGFFIVWALFLNKPAPATDASGAMTEPTAVIEEVVDLDATATAEAEAAAAAVEEEPTEEAEPAATPTPVVGPTSTPDPDDTEGGDDQESSTAVEAATEEPRRSPTPTSTPRPTNTPRPTSTKSAEVDDRDTSSGVSGESEELAATGLGEVMLVVAGVLLIGVAFLARRLRSA